MALQGAYAASKAAIRAFTDELRVGVETDDAPVSVTLVKPGAIDTPFPINAKNYLESEPQHVPPVYAAAVVADAILHCATMPTRDIYAGEGGKLIAEMNHMAPGLTDRVMAHAVTPVTESGRPPRRGRDESILDQPSERLTERGNYPGHVAQVSLYSKAAMHPLVSSALLVGGGLALRALLKAVPPRPASKTGGSGATLAKALHIRLEARAGLEADVERLLQDIFACVENEPGTGPWYGLRLSQSTFSIFESFVDEGAREAHLTGKGAAILLARSEALLSRPAQIEKFDVLLAKEVFASGAAHAMASVTPRLHSL